MRSLFVFLFRVIAGVIALTVTWFVLDTIHDRNTEIIVSCIGLLYSFIFLISRRLQYFGLTIFSFFGQTMSHVERAPYDHTVADEVGLRAKGRHLYLNLIFGSLIELLCLFRLFTSLLGNGWELLSDPLHQILRSVPL